MFSDIRYLAELLYLCNRFYRISYGKGLQEGCARGTKEPAQRAPNPVLGGQGSLPGGGGILPSPKVLIRVSQVEKSLKKGHSRWETACAETKK